MVEKKTSLGIDEHLEGLLCYAGLWVTGIIFLVIDTDNRFVKFHAIQSIIAFGILNVGAIILGFIPGIGKYFVEFIWGGVLALWVAMMYQAYNKRTYKLPFAGNIAEKYSQNTP